MERKTGEFTAYNDFGQQYTIYIYTSYTSSRAHGRADEQLKGLERLCLDGGSPVNWIEKGKYRVVETGAILQSDDPDAP